MSNGWLVDTSALAVAQQPAVAERLARMLRAGVLWSCPVTELEALVVAGGDPREYQVLAEERRAAYNLAPFGPAVGERALSLQGRLVRRDRTEVVSPRDLLVAATAIESELTLLHHDPVFERLGACTALEQEAVAPLDPWS